LYNASENTNILFAADITTQRPDGYAQVIAGVAPTQRAAYRQFDAIIADLNYQLQAEMLLTVKLTTIHHGVLDKI
jgi:iron complex outermembrane receptor protein